MYNDIKANATDPQYPRAYLNYLVFDEDMNLIEGESGASQLRGGPSTWGHIDIGDDIHIGQNGYLVLYVSNESHISTYMDKVTLYHYKGVVTEEQHYYPHGMVMKPTIGLTALENKYLHQGKLKQDELGMQLYDFHARQYDPQIGRFWGIDPMDQFVSGYTGMGNNPANMVDPTGMEAVTPPGMAYDEPARENYETYKAKEGPGQKIWHLRLKASDGSTVWIRFTQEDMYALGTGAPTSGTLVYTPNSGQGAYLGAFRDDKGYRALVTDGFYNSAENFWADYAIKQAGNGRNSEWSKRQIGKLYDLQASINYYNTYSQAYIAKQINHFIITPKTSLTLNGKPISKLYSEAVTYLELRDGVVTVSNKDPETDYDALRAGAFTGTIGSIHNHNFFVGDVIKANPKDKYGSRTWNIGQGGPSGNISDDFPNGDIHQLNPYSNYRSIIVSPTHFYLYNKTNTVAIPR